MRKLAVFLIIFLSLQKIAYAKTNKNFSELLCLYETKNKHVYQNIINNFEKSFEKNFQDDQINLENLSHVYFCYSELDETFKYLNIIDRLIKNNFINNKKYKIPGNIFRYYGYALGDQILNDKYQKNQTIYKIRIKNLIKMGSYLIQNNYDDDLLSIIKFSQIHDLYLDENIHKNYLKFLDIAIKHFSNIAKNTETLKIMSIKLQHLSNNKKNDSCAIFFNKDLNPYLNNFISKNKIDFLIQEKLYQLIDQIYLTGNVCVSRTDLKKSISITLKHIELLEYFIKNIKNKDDKKNFKDNVLKQFLYLYQLSSRFGDNSSKIYEKIFKDKLNSYSSSQLAKLDFEIDFIKEFWGNGSNNDFEQDKLFVNKINDSINILSNYKFETYLKEAPYSEFINKEIFDERLFLVKFKYMNIYSLVLQVSGKYDESIKNLNNQINQLETKKKELTTKYIRNSETYSRFLPELYRQLLEASIDVKDWNNLAQVTKNGLKHCNILSLENFKCYQFKLILLKQAQILNDKSNVVKIINEIDFFYEKFVISDDYLLYDQNKKDHFKKDYLTYKLFGLYKLNTLNVKEAIFKKKNLNISKYICENVKELKNIVSNSKNPDINNIKSIFGALAMSSFCDLNPILINDEYFNLAKKLIDQYKNNKNNQYSDFFINSNTFDTVSLAVLEILSQNSTHPEFEKISKELFKIIQSEEAKFYFKSKNNFIYKNHPDLLTKVNMQRVLQFQYENLLSEIYNKEDKIFIKEFIDKKILLEKKITLIKNEINEKFPNFKKFNFKKTLSVEEIQQKLGKDDALIYLKNSLSAMTIVITKEDFKINSNYKIGNLDGNSYQKLKINLRKNLLNSVIKKNNSVEINSNKLIGVLIYQQFLKPVEAYIQNKKNLYFITDQYMSDIPFELLVTNQVIDKNVVKKTLEEGFEAKYLIEKFNVKYLPNTASLVELQKISLSSNIKSNLNFLGVGNPKFFKDDNKARLASTYINLNSRGFLKDASKININYEELPFTGKELSTLKNIFKKNTILEQNNASETNFKSLNLNNFNIINFATHAEVSNAFDNFNEPFLVLTPPKISSEIDDGLLTSSEISSLNLNADMVILSACDTSSKKNQYASGFSGLISSFLLAGANSVVATHWPVEDSAGYLLITETMKKFVNSNLDFSESLRETKIEFIKGKFEEKFKNPFFWAPYIYVGL